MANATPSRIKAWVALAAPVIGWGYALNSMVGKGYSLLDYPSLILEGRLSWFTQGMGWVATAAWIFFYWRGAYVALASDNIITDTPDSFELASNAVILKKSDIESIDSEMLFFTKQIRFSTRDGNIYREMANFIDGDLSEIVKSFKEELIRAKNVELR
jgi:hypothetical protein